VSWRVIIRPNAEADAREARQLYESQRPGLGDELLEEIRHTVRLLEEYPERRPIYYRGFRRLLSPAAFPTSFSNVSKATASLFFASCTPSGIISVNSAVESLLLIGAFVWDLTPSLIAAKTQG
jgi:hypothetical protein